MEINDNINENIQDMHSTSLTMIILKNAPYLLALLFTPVMNWIIGAIPEWRVWLTDIKDIGGVIVMALVITKLLLEIKKIRKKQ